MDRLTRRSASASLILHGVLVVASLFALGPPPPSPPSSAPPSLAPPDAGAPPPTQPVPLAPLSIAAEDAVVTSPAPRLANLGRGSAPLPPLPVVRATPTDRQGGTRSRGSTGPDPSPVDLPTVNSESPALRALRGIHANPALSHEQDMLATAQWHLENRIVGAYRSYWRGYASQVSNRRIVVWVVADERRRVQRGGLYQCTTGSSDLDRAIEALLLKKDFGLPPIAPGVMTWFQVTLP